MAPASAAALLAAAAAALLLSAAAAATAPAPAAPNGQPGCKTSCGNVSVPYPFGFGPSHCYWPGLNLTCDTSRSHQPPRLLLGDGSLRVTEISLYNSTVRVRRTGSIINTTGDFTSDGWNASLDFGRGFREHGYLLSYKNEFLVVGCNVAVTILMDNGVGEEASKNMIGCASFCVKDDHGEVRLLPDSDKLCTSMSGCCRASLNTGGGVPVPNGIQARWLYSGNHTSEQKHAPVTVYVAEQGWVDKSEEHGEDVLEETLLLLVFAVTQGLPPPPPPPSNDCSHDVQRMVCKSEHSDCLRQNQGYACRCKEGYEGNPYLAGGCQDIDECKFPTEDTMCFGVCINTIGTYDCQCRQGTYGNPGVEGGCVSYNFNKDVLSPRVVSQAPRGMPNCTTSCGDVMVPYPFGFGHPGCYWPGFNLTCDTRHGPPRLLLHGNGTGTLQVVDISLHNSTVRVSHHLGRTHLTTDVKITGDYYIIDPSNTALWADIRIPDIGEPYVLSTRNEFIVITPSGLRTTASLHGEYRNGSSSNTNDSIISQAVCSGSGGDAASKPPPVPGQNNREYCSGHDGCCHAPIPAGSTPKRVEFKVLDKNISRPYSRWLNIHDALAFISEMGLLDQWHKIFDMDSYIRYTSSPIVIQWAVKQGLSATGADKSGKCPADVLSRLCRSENSNCRQENGGFTCHCSKGYDGNPYVADGCQDIDECTDPVLHKPCLDLGGSCINFPGGHECRCPQGMHGNISQPGGCVVNKQSPTRLIIGVSASGPTLLLLVLGMWFLLGKLKQRRIKLLKQKYFKQNRGQLLSQRADIAERMIIPLDELAKATNNFDRAREIGGGGHGIVYKGILSDLHVVAIKKSKITKQKEIDEFINEVAILSQINHKNVVKLFGCCLETEVPLLVYEFIPNGTLDHHLHIEEPKRSLSWRSRLRIATEIATSVAYLHSSVSIPIIHRDIKSSNILLDDTMTSKISDFGASRYIPIDNAGMTTRIQGTFGYLDPECFNTGRLTEKSDVYSFGVILVELLTRKKPTCSCLANQYGGLVPHFLNLLASGNLDQIMDPQVLEEGGKDVQQVTMLAASCINIRGDERPTMRQVELTLEGLQHGSNKKYKDDDMVAEEFENGSIGENYSSGTSEGRRFVESSRRYSLEQEMMISARYPR